MAESAECVVLTFFHFKGFRPKVKAFGMMQFGHSLIAKEEGLSFYKLLGTGRGKGFNPYPDFSTYGILSTWENRAFAQKFIHESGTIKAYEELSSSMDYFLLKTIKSQGEWGGSNPFQITNENADGKKLAVLTRAKIKISKLRKFWSYVPTSSKPINTSEGLLYTKGVGEVPLLNMATFSVWESIDAMKKFAYSSPEHMKAIKMTRELGWYSEELFARFVLLEQGEKKYT